MARVYHEATPFLYYASGDPARRPVMSNPVSPRLLAFLLAALATIGPFSIDTFLPAMATIGHALDAKPLEIQQALTVYLFCYGLMMLWHGAISDAVGRRPVILTACLVFTLASLGCATADSLPELLFYRALQGLSGGAGLIVGRAIIRDTFEGAAAQRLMSQVTMLFSLSPAIAPVIGGWLYQGLGWRSIFVFMALVGLFLFLLCSWQLQESHPAEHRRPLQIKSLLASYRHVAATQAFRFLALAVACNFAGFFLYIPAAPVFLMRHLGLAPTEFLWFFGPAVSGIMLGAWLSGRMAGRRSARELVSIAYRIMATAAVANVLVCVMLPPALPWSVLPMALYAVGMSLAAPTITLFLLDRFPDLRGTVSSMQGFTQTALSSLVAGAIAPLLWDDPLWLACAMCLFLAVGYGMLSCFRRTQEANTQPQ